MLQRALPALLLALAAPVAADPPPVLVCRGHEPEWSLRIDGSAATLATLEARGLTQTGLEGRLQETGGRPPSFVYRGRANASREDLVAMIAPEACVDTMADAEGGGITDYTALVSLPDGSTRRGCCTIVPTAAPPLADTPSPPIAGAPPQAVPPPPPTASSAALPAASGEITAVALPDGRVCRSTGHGATTTFRGQRVNFDCGRWDGDTLGLVGPLSMGSEGLLVVQKAVIEWRESGNRQRDVEATPARVSEVALADGLVCRHSGIGATLVFEGRRASYTCGMNGGETVVLLGELEPVEGGFRITRARVAHDGSGFSLRSTETILVTAPR
jgi:uncharacterized membrane protein